MGALDAKVALVTGGSRGIGRAIAERLARDGAAVAVNYAGDAGAAIKVVEAIERQGGRAIALRADVADRSQITKLFEEVEARLGKVSIVINNAGILRVGTVAESSEEDFDSVFRVNARGAFFVMQESARRVLDGGRIVSVSSSVATRPLPDTAIYAASKAAVELFTKVLARELGVRGITVNAVAPGGTDTGMLSAERKLQLPKETAFGRVGEPTDIADVVAFLASDDSRWITGQTIQVSGGQI